MSEREDRLRRRRERDRLRRAQENFPSKNLRSFLFLLVFSGEISPTRIPCTVLFADGEEITTSETSIFTTGT